MSNVRERLRRKSDLANKRKVLWVEKVTWESAKLHTWKSRDHAAFMSGVNYAIDEIFDAFKLENYDKFEASVLADLHLAITGEELVSDRNTE
jgi:hypothetical protein